MITGAVLCFWTILCLYPFIWVILTSLKKNNDIYGNPFAIPVNPVWENYKQAWGGANVGRSFFNSMMICILAVLLLILVTSMASYALMRLIQCKPLNHYLSLGIMIPIHALLIPSVLLFKKMNLIDNPMGLVLVYAAVNISLSFFILNGFIEGVPMELDEAATIDGCSKTGIFFKIVFPIMKPGIATVATLAFLNCWNDLLLGLVLISSNEKKTLSMAISALKGSFNTQYGLLCAGFVISIIPVVIMYLLFQKQVIAGMTAGAVKG